VADGRRVQRVETAELGVARRSLGGKNELQQAWVHGRERLGSCCRLRLWRSGCSLPPILLLPYIAPHKKVEIGIVPSRQVHALPLPMTRVVVACRTHAAKWNVLAPSPQSPAVARRPGPKLLDIGTSCPRRRGQS